MSLTISVTETDFLIAARAFLLLILPAGVEVVQGQDNRVAEPAADNFVVMTSMAQNRMGTNEDAYLETLFTGSIAGDVLTVTELLEGLISLGQPIISPSVTTGTTILAQTSGTTGGAGTYTVDTPQTVASETMEVGVMTMTASMEMVIQLDIHGPLSSSLTMIIATAWRDTFGVANTDGGSIVPLYTDDPKQAAFLNGEDQWDSRWIMNLYLQAKPSVSTSAEFIDTVTISLNEVA